MTRKAYMSKPKSQPEILHYSNYRTFLRDRYEYLKAEHSGLSHRSLAQKAGLTSAIYLRLVMEGKRNLAEKSLAKLTAALGLKGIRAGFFESLVFFNQSAGLPERNFHYANILRMGSKAGLWKLDDARFQLFSDWKHIAVRELAASKGFRRDARWIVKKLGNAISEKEAEESLKLLSILGLPGKTAGGPMQTDADITASEEVRSLLVSNYHHQMIRMGAVALDALPASKRDISSITIPIHAKAFAKIKEHIRIMRKELLNLGAEQGAGESIVQVNIQLFPLTGLSG